MAPPIDQDWLFLDTLISMADDLVLYANKLQAEIDDPAILKTTMYMETNALLIWKQARDYRARLKLLKELANNKGLPRLDKIDTLADEISKLATGKTPTGNGPKKNQAYRRTDKPD